MLASRGRQLVTAALRLKSSQKTIAQSRNSHSWNYRCGPTNNPKYPVIIAEFAQGFMWWWILWHLFTEPGHVFGEFEYPDPRKWTDEELGIPPQ